jgi:hypothetical protein
MWVGVKSKARKIVKLKYNTYKNIYIFQLQNSNLYGSTLKLIDNAMRNVVVFKNFKNKNPHESVCK